MNRRLRVYCTDAWRGAAGGVVRRACRAGTSNVGALRRVDAVFRDRCRGRIPGVGVFQGAPAGTAITTGLLTDATGFPLMVEAFVGNKAETTTMLPTIKAFMAAHRLSEVTVVADAGMVSEANRNAIEDAGLSYILGAKIPHVPYLVAQWHREHPDTETGDGQVFTQPWPATDSRKPWSAAIR
jgi:hypothetical protein